MLVRPTLDGRMLDRPALNRGSLNQIALGRGTAYGRAALGRAVSRRASGRRGGNRRGGKRRTVKRRTVKQRTGRRRLRGGRRAGRRQRQRDRCLAGRRELAVRLLRLRTRCRSPAVGSAPTAAAAGVDSCLWFLISNRMADARRIDACWRRPDIGGVLPAARAAIGGPVANLAFRSRAPGLSVLPPRDTGIGRRGRRLPPAQTAFATAGLLGGLGVRRSG
jgi:hypothetical protein